MLKKSIIISLFILAMNSFAQENTASIPLLQFIEEVKSKNESIKNSDSINVMVYYVLIENQTEYKIDRKNIVRMEILVIEPEKNPDNLNPSIIISTRIK